MKLLTLIFFSNFILFSSIRAQFKVVQNYSTNYSFNVKENAHQLSDGSSRMQATAIWNDSSVIGYENIDIRHNFLIEAAYYLGYKDKEGADGIVFVIQSEGNNRLGSMGVGMGYAANRDDNYKRIAPSLGVETDTHYNILPASNPIDNNPEDHFEYLINGELMQKVGAEENAKVDSNGVALNIEDSTFHCVKFFWNSESQELSSYLDGQLRKKETFDGVNAPILASILRGNLVFWGFTSGTATLGNIHMVRFDRIARETEACFVEIYKESAYNITNPNCGLEEVSVCQNYEDRNINLGLSTAEMPIERIEWNSVNGRTIITPLTPQSDRVNLQMYGRDIIEVRVFYSNGCVANDQLIVNSNDIDITQDIDYTDTVALGKVYNDSIVHFEVTLNSKLSTPIYLTSNFNDSTSRFELIRSKTLNFSFKPNKIGNYSKKIEFIAEQPCPDTFYVYVVGSVYTKVILELPQLIAYPGDTLNVPFKLWSNISLTDRYSFEANYDRGIISFGPNRYPLQFARTWALNGSEQIIENPQGTILLTHVMKKPLTVDTLFWDNKFIESEIINGWIKLDTICAHEYRLVQMHYADINTYYDAMKDKLIIQKTDNKNSEIIVNISNLSGDSVLDHKFTLYKHREFDLSGLAGGTYFVRVGRDGYFNLYQFIKFR